MEKPKFAWMPPEKIQNINEFIDSLLDEDVVDLKQHSEILDECAVKSDKGIIQPMSDFNIMVLWLKYYKKIIHSKPDNNVLWNKIIITHSNIKNQLARKREIPDEFRQITKDLSDKKAFKSHHKKFLSMLRSLGALIRWDTTKISVSDFIDIGKDDVEDINENIEAAKNNMLNYEIYEITEPWNSERFDVLQINKLLYYTRLFVTVEDSWNKLERSAISSINNAKNNILNELKKTNFSNLYVANLLAFPIKGQYVNMFIKMIDEDHDIITECIENVVVRMFYKRGIKPEYSMLTIDTNTSKKYQDLQRELKSYTNKNFGKDRSMKTRNELDEDFPRLSYSLKNVKYATNEDLDSKTEYNKHTEPRFSLSALLQRHANKLKSDVTYNEDNDDKLLDKPLPLKDESELLKLTSAYRDYEDNVPDDTDISRDENPWLGMNNSPHIIPLEPVNELESYSRVKNSVPQSVLMSTVGGSTNENLELKSNVSDVQRQSIYYSDKQLQKLRKKGTPFPSWKEISATNSSGGVSSVSEVISSVTSKKGTPFPSLKKMQFDDLNDLPVNKYVAPIDIINEYSELPKNDNYLLGGNAMPLLQPIGNDDLTDAIVLDNVKDEENVSRHVKRALDYNSFLPGLSNMVYTVDERIPIKSSEDLHTASLMQNNFGGIESGSTIQRNLKTDISLPIKLDYDQNMKRPISGLDKDSSVNMLNSVKIDDFENQNVSQTQDRQVDSNVQKTFIATQGLEDKMAALLSTMNNLIGIGEKGLQSNIVDREKTMSDSKIIGSSQVVENVADIVNKDEDGEDFVSRLTKINKDNNTSETSKLAKESVQNPVMIPQFKVFSSPFQIEDDTLQQSEQTTQIYKNKGISSDDEDEDDNYKSHDMQEYETPINSGDDVLQQLVDRIKNTKIEDADDNIENTEVTSEDLDKNTKD